MRHFVTPPTKDVECSVLGFRVAAYSLDLLEYLYTEIFTHPSYYFETSKSAPFIIDCGSNIGLSILFFKALFPRSTIIGFEPAPDSFQLLSKNVEANRLTDVKVYPLAVGEVSGKVNLFRDNEPGSLRASTNIQRASVSQDAVEQVRLSDFIDRDVDFLKLDVEGAEGGVLADLRASGRIRNIAKMAIEYHHHINEKRDCFADFLGELEGAGFGYHLIAKMEPAPKPLNRFEEQFQDILVCAYRKDRIN